MTDTDPK